jgi:predicted AAA+ superfamily ATPase
MNEIFNILQDWNFWNKSQDCGIDRTFYINEFFRLFNSDYIISITGPRRSGKSFIMRQIIKNLISKGIKPTDILFVNLEDPRFINYDTKLLENIYDTYTSMIMPQAKPYIFLDEVQVVENFEKWILLINELKKASIIISGSNAKLLSRELGTLLTGRHLDIMVFPLSFKEYLLFKGVSCDMKTKDDENKIKGLLIKYIEEGSFPEVVLSTQKKEILLNYYEDVLTKDLLNRYSIRKIQDLKAISKYYFSNIATLITYKSIERALNISITSVINYTNYLEEAYLIFSLKRFSYKVKEQEKSPKKIYSIDTGLSNAIGFKFSGNYGRLIENIVFLSLYKEKIYNPDLEIYYWKDEQHREVDFVIKENTKIKKLIQVCWDLKDENTKKREIKSLQKAMRELDCKNAEIITFEDSDEIEINNVKVAAVPLYKWLLQ